ncbi:MAG TPA: inosine/xanthosine triphosphatase [Methanomassiliicoccales archaeon]|nr:inosine/xanthosine triphosphatase [Methanomassiliicoccales archaeon]
MKAAVGGTFNVLHKGHRTLLDKAFECGDEVVVGLTSDAFARSKRPQVVPIDVRRQRLTEYLEGKGKAFEIVVLDEPFGPIVTDPSIEVLVVSPETEESGQRASKERMNKGMPSLKIVKIGHVLADDCAPITSTRVLAGEIDEEGRLRRPITVAVGSDNPVKVRAVEAVMRRVFDQVEVSSVRVSSGVPSEPWGDDVPRGAVARAMKAIGTSDFGVGVEAGLFERNGDLYDVQFCAVVDKLGRVTLGQGSGFQYPPKVAGLLRQGKTVGQAFQELYAVERSGKGIGAIGFLTHGLLPRSELSEQAVIAAMVPRMRKELYFED